MNYPQQAETALSQENTGAPLGHRCRSVLSAALYSAGVLGAIAAIPSAYAVPIVGLTLPDATSVQQLVRFDSAAPTTLTPAAPVTITGLNSGEILVGIDFRPSNGVLYGVGSAGAIYTINPTTGAAVTDNTPNVGPITQTAFFGVDFNPVVDRLRVTSDDDTATRSNLRINVDGTTSADPDFIRDTDLAYQVPPPAGCTNPAVTASAYTNSSAAATPPAPPTATTLFGIDSGCDFLFRQDPANSGTLVPIGSLGAGINFQGLSGFDIVGADQAFASSGFDVLDQSDQATLYSINLGTGAATPLGVIGPAGTRVIGIAAELQPAGPAGPTIQFSAATFNVTEGTPNAAITVTRSGTTTGASSVQFATSNGTAVAGSDYTATTATVDFAPNQTTRTVNVQITNDTAAEPSETVNLTLSAPGTGTTLGTQRTAVLTIADNDSGGGTTPPPAGGTTPPPAAVDDDDDGGCTVNPNGKDAGLLALLLSAAFVGLRRRWKK
ncbi:MAG: DUF4394 domain-containing protein [Burkholderiales bacterium]|nr:DUF4394 domain-containing protein [Burkholderiales bacterium]